MAEKQIRENRVISGVIVAKETGISQPTINSWIKNELRRFDEDIIVTLCKYFECDIGDLLKLEED